MKTEKPSDRIIKIVKKLVKEEVKTDNPFADWETLEEMERLHLVTSIDTYLVRAILDYLDEEYQNQNPEGNKSTPPTTDRKENI